MMRLMINRVAGIRVLALGVLLAVVMPAGMVLAAQPAHASTTFTVNSTEDHSDALLTGDTCDTGYKVPGPGGAMVAECTLRAAIGQANYTTGADTIEFAIPGSGVKTIAVGSSGLGSLPTITRPVTIDGYSQPGTEPNTKAVGSDAVLKIELNGAGVPDGDGLMIGASNSTVKGLVVNRWKNSGIVISGSGATSNKVTGNFIGTDATGTEDLGNYYDGVYIYDGRNNAIGASASGARNVISGNGNNGGHGVRIVGSSTGNRVQGNFIGTDRSGTKDLGNTESGVLVGAPGNAVGGTTAGEGNVISGNGFHGVQIYGSEATGNRVQGNFIGTDRDGAALLGNRGEGVWILRASNNTIGGTVAGARNVISGNRYGVEIESDTGYSARDNRVLRNTISRNIKTGVQVSGDGATGNRILSNSVFANGLLGIDLADGVSTPNDPDDADTGPNYLQNFPVLSSARKNATGTTTVRGKLNSTPSKTFNIQFFSNPAGTDEGKTLLGSATVKTDGAGDASFTFSTKKQVRLGQNITATATGAEGTSEFSAPKKVVAR
jgi:CSLREA domain-containing protein